MRARARARASLHRLRARTRRWQMLTRISRGRLPRVCCVRGCSVLPVCAALISPYTIIRNRLLPAAALVTSRLLTCSLCAAGGARAPLTIGNGEGVDMTVWTGNGAFKCTRLSFMCTLCQMSRKATPADLRQLFGLESFTPTEPNSVMSVELLRQWCAHVFTSMCAAPYGPAAHCLVRQPAAGAPRSCVMPGAVTSLVCLLF